MQSKTINLLNGHVYKNLFFFSLPIVIAQLLDGLYMIFDSYFLGVVDNQPATVAVGTVSVIIGLVNFVVVGIGSGGTFLLGQYYGAKDQEGINKTLKNVIYIFLFITSLIMIIIFSCFYPILGLFNIPAESLVSARDYLLIIAGSMPLYCLVILFSCVLRGFGNSNLPLFISGTAAVLRIILDFVFVFYTDLGAIGIGLSTVIALGVSSILGFIFVRRFRKFIDFSIKDGKFDMITVKRIIKYGMPIALSSLYSQVCSMIMASLVNKLGIEYSSAFVISNNISNFIYNGMYGVAMAVMSTTAICLGAKDINLAKKYLRVGYLYSFFVVALLVGGGYPLLPIILRSFSTSALTMEYALERMYIVALDFIICIWLLPMIYLFLGSGRSMENMWFNFVSMIGIRLPLVFILEPLYLTNGYIYTLSIPVSSLLTLVLCIVYFYSNKWTVLKRMPFMEDILNKESEKHQA